MSRLTAKRAADNAFAEARHAKDFVVPHLATARGAMVPALGHARDAVVPALGHARDAMVPVLGHARDAAAPHLAVARDKARATLKDDVMPRVSAGLAASEPVREEAAKRAAATLAALKGQVEAPKPHRARKGIGIALIAVAVGAAGTAAWKAWKLPHDSDDWVHADTYAGGDIPSTPSANAEQTAAEQTAAEQTAAEALADALRVRNGEVANPVSR